MNPILSSVKILIIAVKALPCRYSFLKSTLVAIASLTLASCSILSTASENKTSASVSNQPSEKMTEVTLYQVDDRCQDYVAEMIEVPQAHDLEATVKLMLDPYSSGDFTIAGYRLKINPAEKIAIVDLRLSPDSPRQLLSLSPCEQTALFGSIRETLINHEPWQIEEVHFLEQGKDVFGEQEKDLNN